MSEANFLSGLKVDVWYKVLIVVGAALAILATVYPTQVMTNKELFIFGCGLFSIGVGEWKNHKWRGWFRDASAFHGASFIQAEVRKPDPVGNLLLIVGIIATMISILDFLHIVTFLK